MNEPAIPRRQFWNPKQRFPKPPKSRLREMQRIDLNLGCQGDMGVARMIKAARR